MVSNNLSLSRSRNAALLAVMILSLVFALGCQGSSFFGVADPQVRAATSDVVTHLTAVTQSADLEEAESVRMFGGLALIALSSIEADTLTELDQEKYNTLNAGLVDIIERADEFNYVWVRSRTLRQLAASLGLYEREGPAEVQAAIERVKREVIDDVERDDPGTEDGGHEDAE